MQIVIEIDDNLYTRLFDNGVEYASDMRRACVAIRNGTPLPKGRWINLEKTKYKGQVLPFWGRYECSECGGHGQEDFKHCPNCGAQMEVEE